MPRGVYPSAHNWTRQEHDLCISLLEQGMTAGEVARRLGRSENAIRIRVGLLGIGIRGCKRMSARAVTRLLGLPEAAVLRLLYLGAIVGKRSTPKRYAKWVVTRQSLLTFLRDPQYWPYWQPSSIADPTIREWAEEMRRNKRFLTAAQVAKRFFVRPHTVSRWIRHGRLPAVLVSKRMIVVDEDALRTFVPPCEAPRQLPNAWTHEEALQLYAMLARGASRGEAATALGRTRSAVSAFVRRERRRSALPELLGA